jgi:hypothetical protein
MTILIDHIAKKVMIKKNKQFISLFALALVLTSNSATASLESDFREILRSEVETMIQEKDIAKDILEIRFQREFEVWKKNEIKNRALTHPEALILEESNNSGNQNSQHQKGVVFGIRYWHAKNNTRFDAYSQDGLRGNPSATLDWKNLKSNNIEIFGKKMLQKSNYFTKGLVGGNINSASNGQIQDVDYYTGQVTFSDTTSKAKEIHATYFNFDIGKDYELDSITVSPFIGLFYSKQMLESYGATINSINSANHNYYNRMGWTIGQIIPDSIIPFNYQTIIKAPRIGFSLSTPASDFQIDYEFSLMPYANIKLNDFHNADPTLVTNAGPNGIATGTGWGYATELTLNYQFTKNSKIGFGFKYQHFILENQDMTFNSVANGWNNLPGSLKHLSVSKYGNLINYQLKF